MPVEPAQTIDRWVTLINSVDIEGILELATPNATWWTVGPPDRLPGITGNHSYEKVMRAFEMFSRSVDGFCLKPKDIIVSSAGNSAVLEVESTAKARDGKEYANIALIKFKFDGDGKIVEGREYLDLITLANFFGIPL